MKDFATFGVHAFDDSIKRGIRIDILIAVTPGKRYRRCYNVLLFDLAHSAVVYLRQLDIGHMNLLIAGLNEVLHVGILLEELVIMVKERETLSHLVPVALLDEDARQVTNNIAN